ncbi:MAG: hypothetical protein HYZ00_06045 [Candidatus Hydrogenedentes bacterium]|nr:hypothetical protein [Candidatus Hydrogenedentota bacterium]
MSKRIGVAAWLVVSQLLALASLLLWLIAAGFSLMAFDSGFNTTAVIIVVCIWAYPLFPLVCAVCAWLAFRAGRNGLAITLTTLPLLLPSAYLALLLL